MTSQELAEIVEQRLDEPFTLGRLACNLKSNEGVQQKHHDGKALEVFWRNTGEFWRCTIFLDHETEDCLVQVDLHEDSTVRVESFEPCSVTISPSDGILCLTRYQPKVK
jgi:hypothetical protein